MNLDEQQIKLLSRIFTDAPTRGDGKKFIELLSAMEIDALKQSKLPDDVRSRWMQGQAMAYEALQKQFIDSNK